MRFSAGLGGRNRVPAALAAGVLALGVAGCSGAAAGPGTGPTLTPSSATPSGAVPVNPVAPTAGGSPSQPQVIEQTAKSAVLLLPSKNIGCSMDTDVVRCDIAEKSWTPPPKPATCEWDYGFGAILTGKGPAQLSCTSDSVLGATPETITLEYGHALRVGRFRCTSQPTGVDCRDLKSAHGFTLARGSYQLF